MEKEIESESSRIVCCKFYSRHKSQTIYFAFVQYNKNELSWKSVIGWFCNCKVGSRTVGCCSHITAIIYYLAIGKYLPQNTYIDYSKSILNSKKISTKDLESSIKRDLSFQTQDDIKSDKKRVSRNRTRLITIHNQTLCILRYLYRRLSLIHFQF